MCGPLELIGIASSAIGGGINGMIQKNAVEEQNRQNELARQKIEANAKIERDRQLQFEKLQMDEVTKALSVASPEAVRSAGSEDNKIVNLPENFNVLDVNGPVHNQEIANTNLKTVSDKMKETKAALANMSILSNQDRAFAGMGDSIGRMQSDLSSIGGYRRGSQTASRAETNIPGATVSASQNPLGDLLLMGGQLAAGNVFDGMPSNAVKRVPKTLGELY